MFAGLPFDEKLVDLTSYSLAYSILENKATKEVFFGERVASCRRVGGGKDGDGEGKLGEWNGVCERSLENE